MDVPENSKAGILNEKTLIPISLGVSIAIFAGWIATLQASGAQNEKDLNRLRMEIQAQRESAALMQKELAAHLLSIDTRLAFIQGSLSKK